MRFSCALLSGLRLGSAARGDHASKARRRCSVRPLEPHKCWAASLLSTRCRGPFVPRLINTQPPTTRQRHFGEQTPALILDRATGDSVLTHFRDKHVYVVAQQIEFLLQVVRAGWMYGSLR